MLRQLVITLIFTTAAVAETTIDTAITKGVDFLVQHQNKDGSFGNATRTKGLNIYAPLPDAHQAFHVGSSSLALHGLIESGDRRPATLKAIEKGEQWLLKILPETKNFNRGAGNRHHGRSNGRCDRI